MPPSATRIAALAAISLAVVLVQTILVPFLAIGMIVPDIVLIWVVYLGITRGHIAGSTAGFALGLLLDVLAGNDGMLGLSAFTRTLAGFLAGYTYNENKTLQTLSSSRFPLIVSAAGLVHHLLYFVIFLAGTDVSWEAAVIRYGIPGTVYTALASLLPLFIFARRAHS